MKIKPSLISICRLFPLLLLLALPGAALAQVLVQDVFNGSGGALPDAAKYVWSGQLGQYGTGLLYLSTDAVDESWLRSIAGAAPSAGQTLHLQMRVYAYAENWTPGIYGDGQPRGLRVGNDANNTVEFYSLSHYSVGLRMRKDGVESLASYDLPSGVDTQHDYDISMTTTSAVFKVDGTVAGTFSNNIPTGALNVYADSWDGGGTGNVPIGIANLSLILISQPVITGFAPASGPNGTSVVIIGTNFCGITNVQFDGITAPFTNNSSTLITAIVPAGATNGLITVVSTNGIATSSNNFVVAPRVFNYTTNAGTITITGYIGSGGAVTIPDTIYGLPVTVIGNTAFYNCTSVTNITIGNSVITIGSWAFYDCTGLTSITIPNSVTNLGDYSFYYSVNLTNISLGNGVSSIGNNAFDTCFKLLNLTVPDSVTNIGDYAFSYCSGLTNVSIGSNVISLGNYTFNWCRSLTGITIPNSVTRIGNDAFYQCNGLMNVNIGNGVTNIGSEAFENCSSLTSVTIPDNVMSIGNSAFQSSGLNNIIIGKGVINIGTLPFNGSQKLTAITVNATNPCFSSLNGVLFDKSMTTLIQCPEGKAGSYTIPDSVTNIGIYAFYACRNLTSVTIPNRVTGIGTSAFQGCMNLSSITIPNSVANIGDFAFYYCISLTSAYFKGNAPSLGSAVFDSDTNTVYYVPEKSGWPAVPNLWAGRPTAFWNLPYLLAVNNGTGSGSYTNGVLVPITASDAPDGQLFDRWTGDTQYVANVTTASTVITMPAQDISVTATYRANDFTFTTNDDSTITIIGYIGSRSAVTIPDTIYGLPVSRIGNSAFYSCYGLMNVTIGNNVNNIGSNAFYYCFSLTNITIGSGVTNIGSQAFYYCTSLNSAIIPNSVISIEDNAFNYCYRLTNVTIPNSVISIGSQAFYYCTSLKNITIGEGVTRIGNYAFVYCYGLTSVSIPNSVTSIGDGAYYCCSGITNIVIGKSVVNIGDSVFANCSALKWIAVDAANPTFSSLDGVLFNKSQTTLITYPRGKLGAYTIPNSVNTIGDKAFWTCSGLTSVTIPNNVNTIETYAFLGCPSLASVTIGKGVTSIGYMAFSSCSSLTAVYFKCNAPSLNQNSFTYSGNATVYFFPGTTNWASTFEGLPTVLWNPQAQTCDANFGVKGGKFGFNITGSSNLVIVVEASTNLANAVWTPVSTNTLNTFIGTNGTSYFCDPCWTNHAGCFYRLRSP